MGSPLVINLALTGMVPRRADNPHVPMTADEVAADVQRCYQAGARVFHVHAREPDETPSPRRELFEAIARRIRQTTPQAIMCVTTSGRVTNTYESRSDSLNLEGELKPDLASLTLGSMNFPKQASINEPDVIRRLAGAMLERGIVPELEIFDMGMLDYAHYLIGKGILQPPFVFNLLLGSLGTLAASPLNLALLVERLPAGAFWSAAGIGRFQFPMNALGIVFGGHVRTGLEDNLHLDVEKRELATNELLVQRLANLAAAAERPLATTEQARALIGLSP
jgi:3-keto-5-aminohexanoate cleavage enzyme